MNEFVELLEAAGHTGFRDARGPLGFTQRQAGGKFTRDEADAFIEQLKAEAEGRDPESSSDVTDSPAPKATRAAPAARPRKPAAKPSTGDSEELSPAQKQLRRIPTPILAAELQRRGWIVVEP